MTNTANRALLMLLAIIGVIIVTTGIAWLADIDPLTPGNATVEVHAAIGPWRVILTLTRWALWCGLWWYWERVGHWLFKGDSEARVTQRQYWSGMRHRMMGGIAAVEVIILLSHLMGA